MDAVASPINAHAWAREENEHYVEPSWCSARLFEEEQFFPDIWDPCCGFGTIPKSAIAADLSARGTDIVDRGYETLEAIEDFLSIDIPLSSNIVCNPPFNIAQRFVEKALSFDGFEKGAFIFPVARLNAAHWLDNLPLKTVWLLTPRPSMPPGYVIARGDKPGGGKMDYCWLVFERRHVGPPTLRKLHRDKGARP